MLEAYKVMAAPGGGAQAQVELTFEQRQKSRYRTETSCGQGLGWFIERGHVLSDGEYLLCRDGTSVHVRAASERVSNVASEDQLSLTRAAYHLGNRHVPLQIGAGFLRYQHDHVLDAMVEGLGLGVAVISAPFHPENGAYHGSGHGHSHGHSHQGHG